MAGLVYQEGRRIEKPGQLLEKNEDIVVKEALPFVSRAGMKLDEVLESFGISVAGKIAVDLGVSTGGFTDCLLQRGAAKVYAVDVDIKQVDWNLSKDPRLILIRKNARYLDKRDFPEIPDIVTMDLSFISVLKVLPAVKSFMGEGRLICLIKPQFEVGREKVGKKGLVKDSSLHRDVLIEILRKAGEMGFSMLGLMKPSVRGRKGNQEFFVLWTLSGESFDPVRIEIKVKEIVRDETD